MFRSLLVVVSLNVQDIAATFRRLDCKYSSHTVCLILFNQLSGVCTVFLSPAFIKTPQVSKFVAVAFNLLLLQLF
jgi:hypothetical protein